MYSKISLQHVTFYVDVCTIKDCDDTFYSCDGYAKLGASILGEEGIFPLALYHPVVHFSGM